MLNARALFYALVVMLFIASSSGIFIVSGQVYKQQQTDQFHNQQATYNLKAGFSLLKSGFGHEQGQTIALYEQKKDSAYIRRFQWGLLDIGIVRVKTVSLLGVDSLVKVAALGSFRSVIMEKALYLKDNNSALAVAGQTKIIGPSAIPKLGIKKTTIAGIPFQGIEAIIGNKTKSTGFLPPIDLERLESISNLKLSAGTTSLDSSIVQQSFRENAIVLSGTTIDLSDLNIEGHVIITASERIYIPSSCNLKDAILFAPNIVFGQGFTGSCQAFATQHLQLEQGVTLQYPSVVALLAEGPTSGQFEISIEAHSRVEGLVFLKSMVPLEKKPIFNLNKEAHVLGAAYINGLSQIGGTITGSLTTDKFLLKAGGSVYTNHLLDAKINRTALSTDFVPFLFEKEINEYAIVEWLE